MQSYEMIFLSDLLRKSRQRPHPDFLASFEYIYGRLDTLAAVDSEFNRRVRWLKKLLPRFFIAKLLYCLRYDAMMGFSINNQQREIFGMLSFQKHPNKNMIGMFDIYVSPSRRAKDLVGNFQKMAQLVYELSQRFAKSGYTYIQCGNNKTTKKLLRLYQRLCKKNKWQANVDITLSRIYLKGC